MSTAELVPGSNYANLSMCALILEDNPVGQDSRLDFESFPEDGVEETYSVTGYREIAADRMPQPGFVAYRGGNWQSFNLELKFRAGNALGTAVSLSELSVADLDGILSQMERKVRWCQALCFPLERQATTFSERIKQAAIAGGTSASDLQAVGLGQLTRNDPPYVLVQFGSWLTLRCYAVGYSIRWEHPFHPITVQPYGATVSLSFQRIDLDYPTWASVRNAGRSAQTPVTSRISGSVIVRRTAADISASNNAAANAKAASDARAMNPGAAAARFLSTGSS